MVADGLLLRGRLLRYVEPREYTKRDGSVGASYPALVVLVGAETVKVEYRDANAAWAELVAAGVDHAEEDGMVAGLPYVELRVSAVGEWNPETKVRGTVRLAGQGA